MINKFAAVLAWIIGALAIFAGGQVLLGKQMDYYVIDWLPIFNFFLGVVTFFITAFLIWKNHPFARSAAIATLAAHILVMLILQTVYKEVVAIDSIVATSLRIGVWVIILALLFVQRRRKAG